MDILNNRVDQMELKTSIGLGLFKARKTKQIELSQIKFSHLDSVNQIIKFSVQGKQFFVTGSDDYTIKLWSLEENNGERGQNLGSSRRLSILF